MKKIVLVFTVLFTLLSCNPNSKGYEITAKIDGVEDDKKVTLKTFKDNKPIVVDTTVVKESSFTIKGIIDNPDIHVLSIQNVNGGLPFILENKKLKFTIYKDSLGLSKIEGSKENDYAQEYMKSALAFKKENDALIKQFGEAQKSRDTLFLRSYAEKVKAIREKNVQFNIDYVKEKNNSLFSILLLENLMNSRALPNNEIKEILDLYPHNLKESASGLRISKRIDAALVTAEGSIAPDFTAPTPDGKEITLSEIKGKVTILDFWAAWCGPCRKENPNIVKVYEKYHDKGLEIIGVSLDGNPRQKDAKQAWLDAIEKDGLTWHQVSNLNYFNGPVAKKYNIRSIPATLILDSEGKIVAKNLRGPALENKIAELLN